MELSEKKCSYKIKIRLNSGFILLFELICKPSSVFDDHLSRLAVAGKLKRFYKASRANYALHILHQVGFTQPISLPNCWYALTVPFHPYKHIACGLFLLHYP